MPQLAGGRYELLERAGGGGQGEVWKAHDRQHDRSVALKIRRIDRAGDRRALLREARMLLDLKPHPSLPIVREDFFEGEGYHLVMDWVEGTNLADVLARDGTPGLPLDTVLSYLRQVADALEHLHSHDPPIVHQDLKPANVIIRPGGDVALVDFGISGRSHERLAGAVGTPAFRAPELIEGAEPTPAADVYGLAATALTLLVGAPPRPGLRPSIGGIPPAHLARVWRAIDSGLAYDPQRRPATTAALVEALEPAAAATNIPFPTSVFVGREHDLAAVADLLSGARLVTLIGAGGLGKTRLALEIAHRMLPVYSNGIWLAELAPLRPGASITSVVAALFGVEERRGRTLLEGLLEELRDQSLLLVLDNCEHVLEACASLSAEVVSRCLGVDIVATSRQELGAPGEVVYEVQPLSLPVSEEEPIKSLARSDAVRLFLDRAAAVRRGFKLTTAEAPLVARICRRLDGMPLAIELAASRIGRLGVGDVAERLEESLTLRGDPRASQRHQTLRAAFDWSHSLLSADERRAFARVAIFPSGFTARAAEDVLGVGTDEADNVVRTLADLGAKSLLSTQPDESGEPRFRMLETVRSYALEKLHERDDEDEARRGALAWALDIAREAKRELGGANQTIHLAVLETERENLQEALTFAVGHDQEAALELASLLGVFWAVRGPWDEGRQMLSAVLAGGGGTPGARAAALTCAGQLAFLEASYNVARQLHEEALGLYTEIGDRRGAARALASLGQVAESRVELDLARRLHGRSLAAYREVDDARGIAEQLTNLGNVAEYSSDYETAQQLHEESLAQRRKLGDEQGAATSLLNLGYVMNYRGDARGKEVLQESLDLFRRIGDRYGASRALNLLAIRTWFEGDGEEARALGEEALRLRRDIGDRLGIAVSLESLGGLAAFQSHGVYAATLFGAAERLREAIGSPITPSDEALMNWARSDAVREVGEEAFAAAHSRGRAMRLLDAIALALTPPERATVLTS